MKTILYVGRIERNKGVGDLLEAVSALSKETLIHLHYCGGGGFLEHLRSLADQKGMSELVTFHGHMQRSALHGLLPSVDILVVPTTADFVEGCNKVVIEGVLASVPTVTTDICPATEYVAGSVVLFEAGNVPDLVAKLRTVLSDEGVRQQMREAGETRSAYFYNPANGWAAAFTEIVVALKRNRRPSSKYVPIEMPIPP